MTKRYATFDKTGFPTGFYSEDIHGPRQLPIYGEVEGDVTPAIVGSKPNPECLIPAEAIAISDDQWMDLISNQGLRKWQGGKVVIYTPPPAVATLADYKAAFDARLDAVAQERQYDNRLTITAYLSSTVPEWAAEAQAFVAWRDAALAYMFQQLTAVEAGSIDAPSVDGFVAGIPSIDWQ